MVEYPWKRTDEKPSELDCRLKPEDFPNPEAFQRMNWSDDGGLITFVCHEDTPKGPEYYLAGIETIGKMNVPNYDYINDPVKFPVSPNILNLSPEERDKVAARICDIYRGGEFQPWERIADKEIRCFFEQEQGRHRAYRRIA